MSRIDGNQKTNGSIYIINFGMTIEDIQFALTQPYISVSLAE